MAKPRKYTDLEQSQIETDILSLLARRPFATADLAVRLGRTEREMGWFIGSLRKQRRVVPHVLRNKRQTWRLANTTTSYPPRVLNPLATKTEVGLTTEDEQWMTYWRLPRAERRRRANGLYYNSSVI